MARQYELHLGGNDIDTAITYLVRVGGHFTARKEETQVKDVPTTRVYYGNQSRVHLFDVVPLGDDRIKVSVPGLIWHYVGHSEIKEVQDALSGK